MTMFLDIVDESLTLTKFKTFQVRLLNYDGLFLIFFVFLQ
jgi:hypothetical protein